MKAPTAFLRRSSLYACLTFLTVLGGAQAAEYNNVPVERRGAFELLVKRPSSDAAYVDATFTATFKSSSETITVPGSYDGDGKYKVRFSPPALAGCGKKANFQPNPQL